MANSAEVTYKCVGDKKQIRALYNTLDNLNNRNTPVVDNGWGLLWLGCVITKLGGNWKDYSCRGVIVDFYMDGDVLVIDQETAWDEQTEFRFFLNDTYPDIEIYYREEEPGCELYATNDSSGIYFPDRYYLDCCGNGESEYYETIEPAAKDVQDIVEHPVEPTVEAIQKALEDYVKEHEDEDLYYAFHEYQITDY